MVDKRQRNEMVLRALDSGLVDKETTITRMEPVIRDMAAAGTELGWYVFAGSGYAFIVADPDDDDSGPTQAW